MSALVFLTSYQTCKFHGRSKYCRLHGTTQYNQGPIKICNHLVIHVQAEIPMPKHFFFRQFDAVCHPLLKTCMCEWEGGYKNDENVAKNNLKPLPPCIVKYTALSIVRKVQMLMSLHAKVQASYCPASFLR